MTKHSNPARDALTRAVNKAIAGGAPVYVNDPAPGYTLEHTWSGLILIRDPDGHLVATLEKHASGRPGSGIPSDTHTKLQTLRAELMVAALNREIGSNDQA